MGSHSRRYYCIEVIRDYSVIVTEVLLYIIYLRLSHFTCRVINNYYVLFI